MLKSGIDQDALIEMFSTASAKQTTQLRQTVFDQGTADAAALLGRRDRDRAHAVPGAVGVVDADRRERDMPEHGLVAGRDPRQAQRIGGAQGIDDAVLGLLAVRMIGERGRDHAADRVAVVGALVADAQGADVHAQWRK